MAELSKDRQVARKAGKPVPLARQAGTDMRSAGGPASPMLALQRQIGNRAACELLSVGQAKLDVGAADDRYEKEADAVARQVVSALGGSSAAHAPHPGHDKCGQELDDAPAGLARQVSSVQRLAEVGADGGTVGEETERAISSARGKGAPLPDKARKSMEGAFGADFSGVRVHTGPESAALNDRVQAKAFTIGSDIFFRESAPDAGTSEGQALLAHELTHTIQQGGAKPVGRKRS
ncbi:MAG TPA: DUF4157 domain-containing protein [Acidimicrobiales bacterium]|nr:DUF4157 domain-containing protein [Acidimicrobiales bacterium]